VLGFSAWELAGDSRSEAKDLLDTDNSTRSFTSVEIRSEVEARIVLGLVVARKTPTNSHFFVRICFLNDELGHLSALHIIDLGDAPRDLLVFREVLRELREPEGTRILKTAHESKLTQYIVPLLAGNTKTWVVVVLRPDDSSQAAASLQALSNVRGYAQDTTAFPNF
jgi:hypothetical protein